MIETLSGPGDEPAAVVADATFQHLREAVMAGLPNGRRLLAIRRVEAALDQAETAAQAILTTSTPERVDEALGSLAAGAWHSLEDAAGADPAERLRQLQAAWSSGTLRGQQRRLFERFVVASSLRERLRARHPDAVHQPANSEPLPNVEAPVDGLSDHLGHAIETDEPRYLDETLALIMATQRRGLAIPNGPEAAARWQVLTHTYAGEMPAPERSLFERNMTAWAIQTRLRAAHPELLDPEPPPTEDETRLLALLEKRAPALREAQAHTVPGSITADWLETLAGLLAQYDATLTETQAGNRNRPLLCFYMASAAFALGRGREQMLQPRAAREAYARAGELYEDGGEPEDAAVAREKAAWLGFALRADVDGGSFDDLRRVADGIADPLDRAAALGRLSRQATQANDHYGAMQYAEAAAAALDEAGFPDQGNGPMAAAMQVWVETAASRRTGNAVLKLIQRIGDLAMGILLARHTGTIKADPARAQAIEGANARLQAALRLLLAQSGPVMAEIDEGLRPYMTLRSAPELPDGSDFDGLLELMPQITALDAVAQDDAEPPADALSKAETLVATAERFGQPGPIAQARRVQSVLRQRGGDLEGAEAAAKAGEAALQQGGAGPEHLVDRAMFDAFLMLRSRRCQIAAASKAVERVLDLAEGAIRAIEADRYRISDPLQQGGYLTDRTIFYEMAAFSAFKLERWDSLIEVMDLFKSRAALRGRLAAPNDRSAAELAQQVADDTSAIEAASPEQRDALREHRRKVWSLLAIARMRSAAGQDLPVLTLSSVQSALAADEAVVSWLWVADGILVVLALDRARVHAERVILTDEQKEALARHVEQVRGGRMPRNSMEANVQPVAEAILPPATRAFIAGAERLIFSPHRALHLVPLHAARFDDRFLIEQAAIRYIPNLGSLLLPWQGNVTGSVVAVGINAFGRGLPPLKTAEAEAEAVAAAWRARECATTELIGASATRAAFTGLDLAECRCLHLATHGESVYATALQGDPFASRLCFADGDLEALTLAGLPLRADVVVMSACHSGQRALALPGGSELPGDDLFGLQATLFQAGVRSVIGALWTVDDASAPRILPELHRRLADGVPPEQALRAAIRAYLREPETKKAIYFWAPLFMSSIGHMPNASPGATP
jgi:CHAT domain-containing protein